jgi:REP element-mobilizing transposase RayT
VADAAYFVTFRLKGPLPASILAEHSQALAELKARNASDRELETAERRHFRKIEDILDAGRMGAHDLDDPRVARLVGDAFTWLREERHWRVYAAVAMPNHVHCCLRNQNGRTAKLSEDMGSVKKFVAKRANKELKRHGALWQSENYDHWCRTAGEVERCVSYTVNNPVRAGLVRKVNEWPWLWIDKEAFPEVGQ